MQKPKWISVKEVILDEHVSLVERIAYQLKARLPLNIEVDDLIQAGMIGLLDAIRRYEDTHKAQFETYATLRIRGAILDELRCMDWLPRSVRQSMRKIEVAINEIQQKTGESPSENDIARRLGVSLVEYHKLLCDGAGHRLFYFEDFQQDDGDSPFLDRFDAKTTNDPLQELIDLGLSDAVALAITSLPERENLLMGLYYEQDLNLKEIGSVMGVTESRVSQIHSQAVARIRDSLRRQEWTGVA